MENLKILWADDEIDLLKPHVLYLQSKGFDVVTVTNGEDAIDEVRNQVFDVIFLDENMPGITGLQALSQIKNIDSGVPIIMITKSEEENIMDEAIGGNISDYLIKPVNPNQILLSIKKNVQGKEIRSKKMVSSYQSAFSQIGIEISDSFTWEDWINVYDKLVSWELKLEGTDNAMDEVLKMQKKEANNSFCKFIADEYISWFEQGVEDRPLLSPDIFKQKIFPLLDKGEKVFFIVIDNLRLDQWKMIKTILTEYFVFEEDTVYYGILPTATQYARNAIFSGLMPLQIKKMFPEYWVDEEEEDGKNLFEPELIQSQLDRYRRKDTFSYHKINDSATGTKLVEQLNSLYHNDLNVVVYNFIDILSHSRTELKTIRELAADETAYRSLAKSWFNHSSTLELFKSLAETNCKIVVTTDHGAVRCSDPIKVVGDKNTNTNLRYKVGKNLAYNRKEVFVVHNPEDIYLPSPNVSSKYIFARNNDFLAYPNNYNYYVGYYKDTFQHGGISMEEMIIPISTLTPKKR